MTQFTDSSYLQTLPPLREVIAQYNLGAKKSLGQHFLLDLNLTYKIARLAGDLEGVTVIEVGPGPGGLTRALLATNAKEVIAIERDPRFIEALSPVVELSQGRLKLIEADALTVESATLGTAPRAIIANLPYNVGTPLLIGWLKNSQAFKSLTLMFQKEVAERIVAQPQTKNYGRLAVMTQWRTQAEILFDIPARAFTPPPNVDSSVVQLIPKSLKSEDPTWESMEKLVAAAFNQRRKMLRASLKSLLKNTEALLEEANISPTARAEEIPVEGFVRLAKLWEKN